ncbi:hypothetical protein DBR06_SOUSAS14810075 [Sousa chinensis]|nr:hypothetical protein DBR06_SOUSAS14810075 [Sousa chinensis]
MKVCYLNPPQATVLIRPFPSLPTLFTVQLCTLGPRPTRIVPHFSLLMQLLSLLDKRPRI